MDLWYNMSLSVKLPNHLLCETPVKQSVFVGADGSADIIGSREELLIQIPYLQLLHPFKKHSLGLKKFDMIY